MKRSRVLLLSVLFFVLCGLFVVRLVKLQLIDGDSYRNQSLARVVTKTPETAARGEILDRYCRPLVQNETALEVALNLKTCSDINGTSLAVLRLFDQYGETWSDSLPISLTEPYIYTYGDDAPKPFLNFLSERKISSSETAETVLAQLTKYYRLKDLSAEDARRVIGVRYEIYRSGSSSLFYFSEDVSVRTVTVLKEHSEEYPGVEILMGYRRSYSEENFASHILGYVGAISASEYERMKADGYSVTDRIGKDGIEKICERFLRGTDGYRYLEVSATGAVTGELTEMGKSALCGDDVILTIDKSMQSITEDSLAKAVADDKVMNGETAATSAAAVFLDVATGETLSMASYPDFNLSTFFEDYATLSQAADSPYVNRAVSGAFPPGSTWKLVTAIAGLEEGIITENTTYHCTGHYTFYDDYQPTCNDAIAHGTVNVKTALQKSCNCFFYDVGRQLGSEKLAEYAKKLGFGSVTGIELYGEVSGTVASKSLRESTGGTWQRGEALLAAIGQTDNTATPLQLAVMATTIARNGEWIQPRIIKSVINRETGEKADLGTAEQRSLGISQKTLDIVKRGMYLVSNEQGGTAYGPFRDFNVVRVCAKSGTAETPPGQAAALFVGYAPVDDPQIAFAVVIEHGGTGAYRFTTQVVKDVLSYYFSHRDAFDSVPSVGRLLP